MNPTSKISNSFKTSLQKTKPKTHQPHHPAPQICLNPQNYPYMHLMALTPLNGYSRMNNFFNTILLPLLITFVSFHVIWLVMPLAGSNGFIITSFSLHGKNSLVPWSFGMAHPPSKITNMPSSSCNKHAQFQVTHENLNDLVIGLLSYLLLPSQIVFFQALNLRFGTSQPSSTLPSFLRPLAWPNQQKPSYKLPKLYSLTPYGCLTQKANPPLLLTPPNRLTLLTLFSTKSPLQIKYLTLVEQDAICANGLCFNCHEHFHRGHRCKGKQFLLLLTTEDDNEAPSLFSAPANLYLLNQKDLRTSITLTKL